MKLNDAVWGALLLLLAAAVLVHVQSFRRFRARSTARRSFPGLVACGLAICAALLIFNGLQARTRHGAPASRWVTLAPWTRSRRHVFAFALTIGVNVFYILLVDWLGFIPTGVIYLSVLFAVFGVRPAWIAADRARADAGDSYRVLQAAQGPVALGPAQGLHLVAAMTRDTSR